MEPTPINTSSPVVISVITVAYNSATTIRDTIESVLSQSYPHIEYIVVDGNSTDTTLEVVNAYSERIAKIVSEPDKGIYDAMNKGIKMATGDVVGILNADDIFAHPDVLLHVAEQFMAEPTLQAVHGNLDYVSPDLSRVVRHCVHTEYTSGAFYRGWHPAHPTFYVRRELFETYGLYSLELPITADFELMLRFFECHQLRSRHIPEVMVLMRVGGVSNRGLSALIQKIAQHKRSFEMNALKQPLLYDAYRLLPKLLQYIKRG